MCAASFCPSVIQTSSGPAVAGPVASAMAVASARTHRFQEIRFFMKAPGRETGPAPWKSGPAPRGNERYCCVIVTSSTPASTRLAVAASAASNRMRTVWPANALMLALAARPGAVAVGGRAQRLEDLRRRRPDHDETRKKSALDEFDPWAR